ncbi:hypothetical protein Cni_G19726 [Canna indica]|uniref:CASP-like protein n=1 Tax=Canna indica TaxID=4628 RepID=A0AAQ3QIT4_9LILI|nr:hypothetical protein Cni_G19726 [Canna indica]
MTSPDQVPSLPHDTPEKQVAPEHAVTALVIADKLTKDDRLAVGATVVEGESGVVEEARGRRDGSFSRKAENGFGAVPERLRRRAVMRAAFGLRVSAAVLCLVSLSVMAADNKTVGWPGDSFDRYSEFRYFVSVNAIAFGYSSFQIYTKVHHAIVKKNIIRCLTITYYFDLSMDQILAYLLMSASSIAASRNDVWMSRFGTDEFIDMANCAIAISFVAFAALALSAVISAYNFFRWNSATL